MLNFIFAHVLIEEDTTGYSFDIDGAQIETLDRLGHSSILATEHAEITVGGDPSADVNCPF